MTDEGIKSWNDRVAGGRWIISVKGEPERYDPGTGGPPRRSIITAQSAQAARKQGALIWRVPESEVTVYPA